MKRFQSSALALAICLSACGGGGNGSGSSIPVVTAPSPTPTPPPASTPTPTPTAVGSQPTLLSLTSSTNLEGFAGSNGYYRAQNGSVTYAEDYSTAATVPVRYDTSQRTFTYTSFEYLIPNEHVGAVTLSRDAAASTSSFSEYTARSSGVSYRYTQLTPGASNSLLPLYYSSVAVARASFVDTVTGITKYGITPMAYGVLFNWDKTKLTGSGNYGGIVLGQARGTGSRVYNLSGTVEVVINYDTTAFTGRIRLTARDDVTGETIDLGVLEFTPSGPRGVLDYFYANTSNEGRLQGRLAGSQGEEFIGGFDAKIPDPRVPGTILKVALALAARK